MLKQLLYLNDEQGDLPISPWRISVLRILTLSGLLLVLGIAVHSSYKAWQLGAYHVLYIVLGFYVVLLGAALFARRRYRLGRMLLALCVVGAGATMQFFIKDFDDAKLGAIFLYSLPIAMLMLWGKKAAIAAMAFNLLPFAYLVYNKPLLHWDTFNIDLPSTPIYLNLLLFIFFNLCLPLALMRMLSALQWTHGRQQDLNRQLQLSMLLYRDLFDNDNHPALIINHGQKVMRQNKALARWLKKHRLSINALLPALSLPPENCKHLPRLLPTASGQQRLVELTKSRMANPQYHLLLLEDVTEASQLKMQLADERVQNRRLRWHDTSTGMLNEQGVEHWLARKPRAAVAIMQLCNGPGIRFKYGKPVKDQVLNKIAAHVKALLPKGAIAGRIGRCTLVFCHPTMRRDALQAMVQGIEMQLGSTVRLDDGALCETERHWKIASHPGLLPPGHHISSLAVHLYGQLLTAGDVTLLDTNALQRFDSQHQLVEDLRTALASREQLYLDYQPQCDTEGNIVAAEALLRWRHPKEGNISPAVFIPLAEQSGNIGRLTRWVVTQACAQLKSWQQQGINLRLSVNLSVLDLIDERFTHWLIEHCREQQIDNAMLELEITETALADLRQTSQSLKILSQAGFPLAIDDFGTGHSSLTRLTNLDANIIKIDRDFLRAVPGQARSERMLKAILELCRSTGAEPLVEGVETRQQLDWLLAQGCKFFQGFYLYRPMPPRTLAQLLKATSTA
ncbi:EAL domain-containing protein [Gallaecimonas pentaromativorans]|uniref:EAL domain-containing protein n=1 Tax=Gallaecimonas pentaromativorans TaxID=584787 RepID=UPI003A92107B